jgi:hypothetical protein
MTTSNASSRENPALGLSAADHAGSSAAVAVVSGCSSSRLPWQFSASSSTAATQRSSSRRVGDDDSIHG